MRVIRVIVGQLSTNCYIVESAGEAIVIEYEENIYKRYRKTLVILGETI